MNFKNKINYLVLVLLLVLTFTLVGCGPEIDYEDPNIDVDDGSGYDPDVTVEVTDFDYGFITKKDVTDDTEITMSAAKKPTNLDVVEKYFLLISYNITPNKDNDGTKLLQTSLEINDVSFIDGTIYVTKSGLTEPRKIEKDPTTGKDRLKISVSNKIPTIADEMKEILIVVELSTLKYGDTTIKCNITSKDFKLVGETDGISKKVTIDKVKIAAPTLIFDDATLQIKFGHVAHANYYKVFVDGMVLEDNTGQDVIISVDDFTAVGGEVAYDISQYVSGVHRVKIQAFSGSTNFITSFYSNEVDVNL